MDTVKTQIILPKDVDKMLKMIKVEFELENKSEAVEFVVEAFRGEFKPEIEEKFAQAMTPEHRAISAKRAKTLKGLHGEITKW